MYEVLKGCAELLVTMDPKILLVKKAIVDEKGPLAFKVLLEIKGIAVSRGSVASEGKKGVQGDTSDFLRVLDALLPIQRGKRYGEKMGFVKYHVSEDLSSIVKSHGGVQTLRNVSAYNEPM